MKILQFEDLIAWQKAQDLAFNLFTFFEDSNSNPIKDQILRASLSISNNIAEGFDRNGNPEFKRFLYYSLASCSEVKSMMYLIERLGIIPTEKVKVYLFECSEISKILKGLIRSLK
jgi:four helix bundle protein